MPETLRYAGIVGVGAYAPERVLTNDDLERMVETSNEWILERTGIRERRIAAPEQASSDLALAAAREALAEAGVAPEELDLVIVATNSPDMFFPATACLVQDALGARRAGAFDVSAGCTGFIYALAIGSQFIMTGTAEKVLVAGADSLSKMVNWEDRSTCILFGDAAGAVVLEPVPEGYGLLAVELRADGSGGPLLTLPAGGSRLPASRETVDRKLHTIHMQGREIFKFAVRVMGEAALEVLRKAGVSPDRVGCLIPHQANLRIIEAAAKRLGLGMDRVFVNLDRYGNTSAASIPVALKEALDGGYVRPGDYVVMVAFGTGLTWGGALVRWLPEGRREVLSTRRCREPNNFPGQNSPSDDGKFFQTRRSKTRWPSEG